MKEYKHGWWILPVAAVSFICTVLIVFLQKYEGWWFLPWLLLAVGALCLAVLAYIIFA